MRSKTFIALYAIIIFNLLLASAYAQSNNVIASTAPLNGSTIFSQNRLAIVSVEVAVEPSSPNRDPVRGTGFIIGSDGYVLTARHVVSGYIDAIATPITIRIGSLNGTTVRADLHPLNLGIDVALLKMPNPTGLGISGYQTVRRGEARSQAMGNKLFILGFNSNSNLSIQECSLSSNLGEGAAGNFLWEITAPGTIFGMSGAPVFDDRGAVVGIVQGGRVNTSLVLVWPEEHLEGFASIVGWTRPAPLPITDSPIAANKALIISEIRAAHLQTGWQLAFFEDWDRSPYRQSLRVERGVLIATAPGRTVSTSVDPNLLPTPRYFNAFVSQIASLGAAAEEVVEFFSSYERYRIAMTSLNANLSDFNSSFLGVIILGRGVVTKGRAALCALGVTPPSMFPNGGFPEPVPLVC